MCVFDTIDDSDIKDIFTDLDTLNQLFLKTEIGIEDLKQLGDLLKKVIAIYNEYERVQFDFEIGAAEKEKSRIISLKFLNLSSKINEKIAISIERVRPKSEQHVWNIKSKVAIYYLKSLQQHFDYLQESGITSNLNEEILDRVVSETESPYYNVKELIQKVKRLYDELAVIHLTKNKFEDAHNYYYLLGETIVKEIYYSKLINDDFLYGIDDLADLYYQSGKAFLRSYKLVDDRYIVFHYGDPITDFLRSNIKEVFDTGNVQIPSEDLATISFEIAKSLYKTIGNKARYLESKKYLYDLKSENNDFEYNISLLFKEISKIFVKTRPPFIQLLDDPKKVKEGFIRDYFMSHINLMIEGIAVAENIRTKGFSDLTIFGKDNLDNIQEAIAEFKIWGRNSQDEDHSYKAALKQLRNYMSDFEQFGVVVMINPNKNSIKQKYISKIIENDSLFLDGSIDEPYQEGAFTNLVSQHFVDDSKEVVINIYHFILNINNLF